MANGKYRIEIIRTGRNIHALALGQHQPILLEPVTRIRLRTASVQTAAGIAALADIGRTHALGLPRAYRKLELAIAVVD